MTTTKAKAYSYIRFSDAAQSKGDSVRRQLERSRAYAEKHNLDLQDEMLDEGVSAYRGRNIEAGAFATFLTAVKANKVPRGSYLLVESLDRVSRQDPYKSLPVILEIINRGINIVTVMNDRVFNATRRDSMDIMYSLVELMRAFDEADTRRDRIEKKWQERRANAATERVTSVCPAWLRPLKDNGFEPIPERVAVVRRIFELSASGVGNTIICRRLNEEGIPTFGKQWEKKKAGNKGWFSGTINRILSSRSVLGEFQPHRRIDGKHVPEGDPIAAYYPRIVSDELFYKAKQSREQRLTHELKKGRGGRKGQNYSNLFSGIAKCVYCKSPMHFENKGPNGARTYLVCSRAKRGLGCIKTRWAYNHFEAAFLGFIDEVDLAAILREGTNVESRLEDELTVLRGKRNTIEKKLDAAFDMLSKDDKMDFTRMKFLKLEKERSELIATIEKKEHEQKSIKSATLSKDELKDVISRVQDGENNFDLRASIAMRLQALIDKVYVATAGSHPFLDEATYDPDQDEVDVTKIDASDVSMRTAWFVAKFKTGTSRGWSRLIAPDQNDPRKLSTRVIAPLVIK
jgi:DNA invertase Pin-like site-specific DNA recombinase